MFNPIKKPDSAEAYFQNHCANRIPLHFFSPLKFHNQTRTTMKKTAILFVVFLLSVAGIGFAQTTPSTDFFAGKWEISIAGTPNGDVKFVTELVRKEGKLTGELSNPADPTNGKRPITKVEENGDKVSIYFEAEQVGELSIDLAKVDDDNLKGTVYNFETKAKRVK